jgi:hypothetical protein
MNRSTSWWRAAPAALIAVAAIAVIPATAGAVTVQPSVWNNAAPATSPGGLSNASMTNDATVSGSLLFGGENAAGTAESGTWAWNGTTWSQVTTATTPPARINAALARTQNGATNGAVLFGGCAVTTAGNCPTASLLDDTYTWNGTNWTLVTPTTSPPALSGATMEYYDGEDILFGGWNGTNYTNQTWMWNGTTWANVTGTGAAPPIRAYAAMAEDTGYGNGTGALVLFGGYSGSYLGDTWTYIITSGTGAWTQQSPTTSPSPRAYAAMAYNGSLAQPTLFGGYNGTILGDTWQYLTTNQWVQQSPSAAPPARAYAAMADNSTDGQMVLYGGQTTTATSSVVNDTWLFYSAPNAPTRVTAALGPNNGQATVTFYGQPFYGNGGYTITSYTGSSSPGSQTCTVSPPGTDLTSIKYSCVVSGLTDGTTYTFTVTASNFLGSSLPSTPSNAVTPEAPPVTPSTSGYWLVARDGGIFTHGSAGFYGSQGATPLNQPIVAMASTPDHKGYWLVASDGGIFTHGDAGFFGSHGGSHLNSPIVGMAATPSGNGYWLVAADGGIFTYGDAGFFGSHGGSHLNSPIVAMAATPSGNGYWLVAADGGIFTYGDAGFYGSQGATPLNKPIVGMAATPDGKGYWLVATDGGIFTHGDAGFYGSQGATPLNKPIVAMASTSDGLGYYLVASDGGIFTHGDATFDGSQGATPLNQPIVGMASSS